MPPQQKLFIGKEHGGQNASSVKSSNRQHNKHHHQTHSSKSSSTPRYIFFRVGPLRFGVHGISGILGTLFVSHALWRSFLCQEITILQSVAVVSTSLISSVGSYGLLPQVPNTSQISSWIFPPHKEAFKRTIDIVGYLNLRLVHEWGWLSSLFGKESMFFPLVLFLYTNYHFFPRTLDYANGNTWVFVIPMFIGFNIDTWKQFPRLVSSSSPVKILQSTSISTVLATTENDNHDILLNWDDVQYWNHHRVDETYLLLTLLCALQIAFMFTVAFRGRMSIKACYWIAAIEVGLLCIRLFYAS